MIACWEAKYHYMFWRPNHAIGRADTDGNPATTPEGRAGCRSSPATIPSTRPGHACFTAGVAEVDAPSTSDTKKVPSR